MEDLIALLVAAPLLGAAVLLCGGKRLDAVGHWIGTALAAASFVIGAVLFADMLGKSAADRPSASTCSAGSPSRASGRTSPSSWTSCR